jgi:hypothetical protein
MAGMLGLWGVEPVDRFLGRFGLPLVMGGRVACGDPLGVRVPQRWMPPRPNAPTAVALHQAMRARVSYVDPVPPADPSGATWVLLAAAHDLLTSVHPDTSNVLDGAARTLRAHAKAVLALGWPEDLPEALARHAVVDAMVRAQREDVRVKWWTGTAEFPGAVPPARLLLLPRLRRVSSETLRIPLVREGLRQGSVRMRAARRMLVEAMFVASPLTPLILTMEDASPVPLDLRQARGRELLLAPVRFLGHRSLRTLLSDRALAAGFRGPVTSWSQAVNALLTTAGPPPWAVARALRFTLTLHEHRLYALLQARKAPAVTGAVRAPRDTPVVSLDEVNSPSARLVWGLWRAARALGPRLGIAAADVVEPLSKELMAATELPAIQEAASGFVRAAELRLVD